MPTPPDPIALAASAGTPAEIVEALSALEDLKAQACATQARLAARLVAQVRQDHRDRGLPGAKQGRGADSQVALARRESPARGRQLLGLAQALVDELPCTLAAMDAGSLSEWRAMLIARETACLSREDRATIDAELCTPIPAGGYPFDGWGDRRLTAETQKLVASLDPAALVNRRKKAESERRLSLRPAPDTMARLSVLLPAAQGIAVWATLARVADQAVADGDGRSRQQIMVDTLVERITGQSRATAVPVTVNLVVSDDTLLGGGHEPAWLLGYGPLTADAARDLTLRAARDATAELRRLYATPETGDLVSMDSSARFFPPALATFIELRDRTCRTPWCDAPIRQTDHVVSNAAGGPTTRLNGQGLCQQCNLAKEGIGWRSRPVTGPPGSRHTVVITLPTGQSLVSTAPAAPRPAALRHRSAQEWRLLDLVMAS